MSIRLHLLHHESRVEFLLLDAVEIGRRQLIAKTNRGTVCSIALPRTQRLADGAVLLLEDNRAIVVRAGPLKWLIFKAEDTAAGIELGYSAGHMQWPVRFEGDQLYVVGELGSGHVLGRLHSVLDRGVVTFLGEGK